MQVDIQIMRELSVANAYKLKTSQQSAGTTVAIQRTMTPSIQRTYPEMAKHYGTVILPARPYRPRDKAKVEIGVQIAERWIARSCHLHNSKCSKALRHVGTRFRIPRICGVSRYVGAARIVLRRVLTG